MRSIRCRSRWIAVAAVAMVALASPGCGGAGGGAGPEGAGQGLVLISFLQASTDNVALNTRLELRFSEALNPTTVNNGSIQIREGDAFGRTVPGDFFVVGANVFFEPVLPSRCDFSDAGFQPDTQYRVQVVGYPEEFAIKNAAGQTLNRTTTWEFHTRLETDPNLFTDQIPGVGPSVDATSPLDGAQAVDVAPLGGGPATIELTMSENLNPCSVTSDNVLFEMYEIGDPTFPSPFTAPNGNGSGFYAVAPITPGEFTADQTPGDVFTWGADTSTPVGPAQTIPADIQLVQDFTSTRIVITPLFGQFPDNALLVVRLTFNVIDFGGQPMQAFEMSFTTENNDTLPGSYTMEVLGETPFLTGLSTADINTARAPSNIQGFLLFSGDGDNGLVLESPSGPDAAPGCTTPLQDNNGMRDDFDPTVDCLLDTGASNAPCTNTADGSTAVVYEFASFRIRSGVTVRIVGSNPAIILVQGDVTIESNGRLLARGDGGIAKNGVAPQGRGVLPADSTTVTTKSTGGIGVAGGGDGGDCPNSSSPAAQYAKAGVQGYFMTPAKAIDPSVGTDTGPGVGKGNTSCRWGSQVNPNNRNTPSGGGGGHAADGLPGVALGSGSNPTSLDLPLNGAGGGTYGDDSGQLLTPEAGSGGGAGGLLRAFTGTIGQGPGGAGGAGGGFLDLTASGTIAILGTIDVAGSRGGNGMGAPHSPNYAWNPGGGGGGGGSGGGMRLLTPSDIVVGSTTTMTAAGGAGGPGGASQGATVPPLNPGGAGGPGRICLEDSDSVIAGAAGAMIVPGEGNDGFYRNVFQATRFQGGGTNSVAVSDLFAIGPLAPTYITPVTADFVMGIPDSANALLATGDVVMEIEVQGFPIKPDGTPDTASGTGYRYAGYIEKSLATTPVFVPGTPPRIVATPADRPDDNNGDINGDSIVGISPSPYFQLRVTFSLPIGLGVLDPGPFIDRWVIRFTSNQ